MIAGWYTRSTAASRHTVMKITSEIHPISAVAANIRLMAGRIFGLRLGALLRNRDLSSIHVFGNPYLCYSP
eukprot:674496-Amorphochlora_amoeboformis.AAC.1